MQGRGREANRFAGQALAIPMPGAQRLHALVAAGHIAHTFRDRKRARLFFEEARLLAGDSLPADHPDLGPLHSGLGLLDEGDGHHAEAEKHYREALRIAEKHLDPFHPEVGSLTARLAAVCARQGKVDAETFRLRSQSIEMRNSLTVSGRALRIGRE
jgi:tetratricopeptide (TPR) repeat protein